MSLHHDVLRAFERACAEGDTDVAEKLLQALEVIDARSGEELDPGLAKAYFVIADAMPRKAVQHHARQRRVPYRVK